MKKKAFTLKEASDKSGYSRRRLQEICKEKQNENIGVSKIGRDWFVSEYFIDKYLPSIKKGRPHIKKPQEKSNVKNVK